MIPSFDILGIPPVMSRWESDRTLQTISSAEAALLGTDSFLFEFANHWKPIIFKQQGLRMAFATSLIYVIAHDRIVITNESHASLAQKVQASEDSCTKSYQIRFNSVLDCKPGFKNFNPKNTSTLRTCAYGHSLLSSIARMSTFNPLRTSFALLLAISITCLVNGDHKSHSIKRVGRQLAFHLPSNPFSDSSHPFSDIVRQVRQL